MMSNSEEMSNSEGMSNSEVRIINIENQIIHSCIQNKTGSKCDWNPNIGKLYSMKEVDSKHSYSKITNYSYMSPHVHLQCMI